MKRIVFTFLLIVATSSWLLHAEDSPCDTINMTCSLGHDCLYYDISRNGTITPAYVDSAWITHAEDTSQVIKVYYVQSGEPMDISFLERGYYFVFIRVGECVFTRLFIVRGTTTDVESVNYDSEKDSLVKKILHNGHIYIMRGDQIFNAQGLQIDVFW